MFRKTACKRDLNPIFTGVDIVRSLDGTIGKLKGPTDADRTLPHAFARSDRRAVWKHANGER